MAPPSDTTKGAPRGPAPKRKLPRLPGDSRIADLVESVRPWRNALLIAVLVAIAFASGRIQALKPIAAQGFSMIYPIAAIALTFYALRSATGWLRWAGVALAALLVIGAEMTLAEVWYPGAPLATVTLTEGHSTAAIQVPGGVRDLEVQARGKLRGEHGAMAGNFEVELERGGERQTFTGEFSRVIGSERRMMRRMAPSRSVTTTEIVRQEMTFGHDGAVHAKLVNIEGAVHHAVRLSLMPLPSTDHPLTIALIVLVVMALVLEVVAARKTIKTPLLAGAAASAVLAIYMVRDFDPDDPLTTFYGGAVVAFLAGGLGGILVGKIATFLFASGPVEAEPGRAGGGSGGSGKASGGGKGGTAGGGKAGSAGKARGKKADDDG